MFSCLTPVSVAFNCEGCCNHPTLPIYHLPLFFLFYVSFSAFLFFHFPLIVQHHLPIVTIIHLVLEIFCVIINICTKFQLFICLSLHLWSQLTSFFTRYMCVYVYVCIFFLLLLIFVVYVTNIKDGQILFRFFNFEFK